MDNEAFFYGSAEETESGGHETIVCSEDLDDAAYWIENMIEEMET